MGKAARGQRLKEKYRCVGCIANRLQQRSQAGVRWLTNFMEYLLLLYLKFYPTNVQFYFLLFNIYISLKTVQHVSNLI